MDLADVGHGPQEAAKQQTFSCHQNRKCKKCRGKRIVDQQHVKRVFAERVGLFWNVGSTRVCLYAGSGRRTAMRESCRCCLTGTEEENGKYRDDVLDVHFDDEEVCLRTQSVVTMPCR